MYYEDPNLGRNTGMTGSGDAPDTTNSNPSADIPVSDTAPTAPIPPVSEPSAASADASPVSGTVPPAAETPAPDAAAAEAPNAAPEAAPKAAPEAAPAGTGTAQPDGSYSSVGGSRYNPRGDLDEGAFGAASNTASGYQNTYNPGTSGYAPNGGTSSSANAQWQNGQNPGCQNSGYSAPQYQNAYQYGGNSGSQGQYTGSSAYSGYSGYQGSAQYTGNAYNNGSAYSGSAYNSNSGAYNSSSAYQSNSGSAYTGSYTTQQPSSDNGSTPPPEEPPKKEKKKGSGKGLRVAAFVLAGALVGGLFGFGGAYAALKLTGTPVTTETATVYASDRKAATLNTELVEAGEAMTTSQIYEAYNDSVVCITVQTSSGTGAGTGFFITDDGYIMTCYHVVEDQTAISVTLNDGTTSYVAEYVGGDEDQDVAIIKISATDSKTFHAVTLGDSSTLSVGDDVTAIGNALGELANTTTDGIVSALNRAITMSDGTVMNLLQTNCTINSGNSGGPLFNAYGEVIGIVNAKYSSSGYSTSASIEGIGFAIPINDATEIMSDLLEYGYVTGKPYLGISVSTISSIQAQMYPDKYVVGAYVNSVNSGSCAETAGLQAGDIITQVDGVEITTSAELIDAKSNHKAGEEMTLLVYRSGEYFTITVTLDEEQPEDTTTSQDDSNNSDSGNSYNYGGGSGGSGTNPFGGSGSSGGSGTNPFGGSGSSGW